MNAYSQSACPNDDVALAVQPSASSLLAPWLQTQLLALLAQRGHAWLLQGPSGLGQYDIALAMVQAWMCDMPTPNGACGMCSSCHGMHVRTQPDVLVLMPEVNMLALGWPLSEKAQAEIDDKKRKPSREIRVDAMRDAIEFCQRTSSRGRGKAVLVYPAEAMNHVTANALLKTLEEPPGDVRFVLATQAAHQLLPTIRSRCIVHTMQWPSTEDAEHWLQSKGIAAEAAAAHLQAAGGRPSDALVLAHAGRSHSAWAALPRALLQGDGLAALGDMAPAAAIAMLQKLCHDLMLLQVGATPRFFQRQDLPTKPIPLEALNNWWQSLHQESKNADHPYNAALAVEALVAQVRNVLHSR